MAIKFHNPKTVALAGKYSLGAEVPPGARVLYLAGQVGLDAKGKLAPTFEKQAEQEGLDRILLEAGFEWRDPCCSMCLGMNPDKLTPGQRCASTSNRNFEGRQGPGGRTHLVSPAMAAAAAVTGRLADVRQLV